MSELSEAINEMRNMRESYDQIGAAAEAYNTGKTELAANINAKGVQASADETLPELAEKVAAISQETYEINGGEMYAKQLFGSLETPNYWNLYDILAQLLSDGRLVSYGGILLAEYNRGYDSLALAGAGAGGAYVVSDLDENGQFKIYTEDITHVWATEFDGKGNRWVAYCFADEYHDFQIADTNTSPRSIFIGRKVGTITAFANTRISQIVVPDGNELNDFLPNDFSNNFGKSFVLRNINGISHRFDIQKGGTVETVFIESNGNVGTSDVNGLFYDLSIGTVVIKAKKISGMLLGYYGASNRIFIQAEEVSGQIMREANTKELSVVLDKGNFSVYSTSDDVFNIYIGYLSESKSAVSISLRNPRNSTKKIELQKGWCKPLNISTFVDLTKENVQTYIFDRLGVNDLSTGAVTITLANAVLNLFTQEEIDAVVARTNITIVGA